MTDTLIDVQAAELRQLLISLAAEHGDFVVEPNGTIVDDGRKFEILVLPKGLAELQAGLIAEVRGRIEQTTPANDMAEITMAFYRYDRDVASLGKDGAGV